MANTINIEELNPLCVRIKNAFTIDEIELIHATYQHAINPDIQINPNAQLKALFNNRYIECQSMSSFTIYNDKKDEKDNEEDLIEIKISQNDYSTKHGLSNIVCFVSPDRLDKNDLKQKHSKNKCKTERRNFGYISNGTSLKADDKVNGHTVTYLDAIFYKYAKNVYNKMMNYCKIVDDKMEWNLLPGDCFQAKCIEYIQYIQKGDNLGWHCDLGSLVNIVIMLSDSSEYKGGNLQCKKLIEIGGRYVEQETIDAVLEKGDIVIFSSDKCNHRVSDLISGQRKVLVCETVLY
eukprot:101449_1